ncbi:hypothetical protein SeLEV6574_g03272 [Synchytrium endobioticum]|uniref:Uncharacterized protein n=1 Tax=Synchytrium endobioticum TaxID=286115 RepID=A0A507D4K4_9FUNG|nr:hypothetical protein SeLEV6574_g03272 [Synchytrium endobioticum]
MKSLLRNSASIDDIDEHDRSRVTRHTVDGCRWLPLSDTGEPSTDDGNKGDAGGSAIIMADGARDGPTLYALSLSHSLLKVLHTNTNRVWRHNKDDRADAAHVIRHAISALENVYTMYSQGRNINQYAPTLPPIHRDRATRTDTSSLELPTPTVSGTSDYEIPAFIGRIKLSVNPCAATDEADTFANSGNHDDPETASNDTITFSSMNIDPPNDLAIERRTIHLPPELLSIVFSNFTKSRTSETQSTLAKCARVSHAWYIEASRALWSEPLIQTHQQLGSLTRSLMIAQANLERPREQRLAVPAMRKLDLSKVCLHDWEGAFTLTRALCWRSSLSWSLTDVRIRADQIGEEALWRLLRRGQKVESLMISGLLCAGQSPRNQEQFRAALARVNTLVLENMRPRRRGINFADSFIISSLDLALLRLDLSGGRGLVDDKAVKAIAAKCFNLQGLWLSETVVGDVGIKLLGQNCKQLKTLSLNLTGTSATDITINLLATSQPYLKGVWFNKGRAGIPDRALVSESISNLITKRGSQLHDLAIAHWGLYDTIINLIAEKCTDLRRLWLGGNATHGAVVEDAMLRNLINSCTSLNTLVLRRAQRPHLDPQLDAEIRNNFTTREFGIERPMGYIAEDWRIHGLY